MSKSLLLLCAALMAVLLLGGCTLFEPPTTPSAAPSFRPPAGNLSNNASLIKPSYPTAPVRPPRAPLEMRFINASFGDATLIQSANTTLLFDTGPASASPQVIAALRAAGVEKIDLLILSSNDPSYVGAAPDILRTFVVKRLWHNGQAYTDGAWADLLRQAQGIPAESVDYGTTESWGPLRVDVLNPQEERLSLGLGADSITLKVSYGDFCAILFSDAVASGAVGNDGGTVMGGIESKIVAGPIPLACPVLRVGKHGSGNAASFQLLEAMRPQDAIISVGPNPPEFTYPEPTTLRRLALRNVSIYTTDRLGTITLKSDGSDYNLTSPVAANSRKYVDFISKIVYSSGKYWN